MELSHTFIYFAAASDHVVECDAENRLLTGVENNNHTLHVKWEISGCDKNWKSNYLKLDHIYLYVFMYASMHDPVEFSFQFSQSILVQFIVTRMIHFVSVQLSIFVLILSRDNVYHV